MTKVFNIVASTFDGAQFCTLYGLNPDTDIFAKADNAGQLQLYAPDSVPDSPTLAFTIEKLGKPIVVERQKSWNDNNPHALATYTLPTSSAARFDVKITASNGTAVALFWLVAQFKRGSGNAIQVGATQSVIPAQKDAGASAWTATIAPSGTDAVLTVTGASGVQWLAEITGRVFNP